MTENEIQRILRGRNEKVIAQEWEYADWLSRLAPWDTYFTINPARREVYRSGFHVVVGWSEASCQRAFERYVRQRLPGVPVVYGVDPNPACDGHHLHGMAATSGGCYRKAEWEWWQNHGANSRILPLRSLKDIGGVSGYVAKYPLSGARWWNVVNCGGQLVLGTSSRRGDTCSPCS